MSTNLANRRGMRERRITRLGGEGNYYGALVPLKELKIEIISWEQLLKLPCISFSDDDSPYLKLAHT
jgi:hypothetical protein